MIHVFVYESGQVGGLPDTDALDVLADILMRAGCDERTLGEPRQPGQAIYATTCRGHDITLRVDP